MPALPVTVFLGVHDRAATAPHARAIKQHFGDALAPEQFEALDDILDTLNRHLEATR